MESRLFSGGCQCGRVRYEADGDPVMVALCHCTMCRRANAAPAQQYWDSKRLPWLKRDDALPHHAEFPPMG